MAGILEKTEGHGIDSEVLLRASCTSFFEQGKRILLQGEKFDKSIDSLNHVINLLKCKQKLDEILSSTFETDSEFHKILNSSLRNLVNLNKNTGEYLALFLSSKINKIGSKATPKNVELVLDPIIHLVGFLDEKDLFERFYRQNLARRLLRLHDALLEQDHYPDRISHEMYLVQKIESKCGPQLTSKLVGMITDMEGATILNKEFNSKQTEFSPPILNVLICNPRYWPCSAMKNPRFGTSDPFTKNLFQDFRRFYSVKYPGRVLKLLEHLGSALLKVNFGDSQRNTGLSSGCQVQVSTHQMLVLLVFNEIEIGLTFQNILTRTGLPASDVTRALQGLAMGKRSQRILVRQQHQQGGSYSTDIDLKDIFQFNEAFTKLSMENAKIPGTDAEVIDGSTKGRKRILDDLKRERKSQIDATILKIMKANTTLPQGNLMKEVEADFKIKCVADSTLIQNRIEDLIHRNWLARTDDKRFQKYLESNF